MYSFKLKNSKIPIKSWISKEDIEDGAIKQINNMSSLPFAYHHIAIMPDVHQGFGVTIGGVLATKGMIIPNAVGVDIGCGMCAVKTSLKEIDTDTIKKIMGEIRKAVPVGFSHHEEAQDMGLMPQHNLTKYTDKEKRIALIPYKNTIVCKEHKSARYQIGTLGGGNHFIEIQKGDDDYIWIMIHSGSRNIGYKVAEHYNKLAKELNKKWQSEVPPSWDLAFLPVDSKEGELYIDEMNYCVEFALANRKLMMERVCKIFQDITNPLYEHDQEIGNIQFDEMINIAHNYASLENHFGENVWVHRKGATLARKDTIGIIPGSQGTASYIVKGKGNPESFMSCSHGAGRVMSRTKARAELDLEAEKKKLDDLGIVHEIRNQSDLDEASSAYKDIDIVMDNQKDLVEILVKLTPLAVIKG